MDAVTQRDLKILTDRPDLLKSECEIVSNTNRNWRGRLADLGDYGFSGGSAGDRKRIVEVMAAIESGWLSL